MGGWLGEDVLRVCADRGGWLIEEGVSREGG